MIIKYFRYVDDILIIYNTNHTNAQNILTDFNTIHPTFKIIVECETNSQINFLDVTIHRTPTNLHSLALSFHTPPTTPPNTNTPQ